MKILYRFILIFVIFIFTNSRFSYSQVTMSLGYNMGFPVSIGNLNYVIDRYNETRPYLSKKMERINYLDGFAMSLGIELDPIFFECGYTGGGQKRFAEALDNDGNMQRRDLRVRQGTFDINLGATLSDEKQGATLLGLSMCIGSFTVKTRTGLENEIRDRKWEEVNNSLVFTGGVFLRIHVTNPGLYIEPYYRFTPGKIFQNDMVEVNDYINPNTSGNDPSPLMIKHSTVGVKIGFGLVGND